MSGLTKKELVLLKESGYSEKVIELYKNRVNVEVMDNPSISLAYTGLCGDTMKLYLKISNEGVKQEAKFQCLGCPEAASSGSAVTRTAVGKTLEDAKTIAERDVLQKLGGLPESKLDCPKLAVTTLRKPIAKYEDRKRRESQLWKESVATLQPKSNSNKTIQTMGWWR